MVYVCGSYLDLNSKVIIIFVVAIKLGGTP